MINSDSAPKKPSLIADNELFEFNLYAIGAYFPSKNTKNLSIIKSSSVRNTCEHSVPSSTTVK